MNQELTLEQAFTNAYQAASVGKFTLAEGEVIKQSFKLIAEALNKVSAPVEEVKVDKAKK